jgi:hypothetical protein
VSCGTSQVVPGAHRVVGPGTHRGSGPREVHTIHPDPVSARRASGLGFVVQPSNPTGFVVNRRKPRAQTLVVSCYPAPAPIDDFVLLFLPPCGLHLTPLATGSLESSLLVSPLLRGPARHRPFALTLHLHQRKSSRNLHQQYSAKSQSTPHCQSLITARSDHPPVLGRSGPHCQYEVSTWM